MPLYEYECESCQKRFEKIRKFSDPPLKTCDLCGNGPIRKLFSSPAIQFKGSGFYITDYAKKSSTEAGQTGGQAEGTKSSSSESDASAKSDSSSSAAKPESSSKTDSSSSKSDSSKSKTSSSSGDGAAAKTTTKTE